ncbi:MAG: transcription elongation factor GreA [Immundisolibacterales bacterium]|nr:transcription elongation factor GreA [Immundisolibacterales bacterium]
MNDRPPITSAGAERLRAELDRLRNAERPRVIRAIGEAREHGDLRENAEYHAAREEQSFLEGRIAEIESQLARAQIVDPATLAAGGRVVFGATVGLVHLDSGEESDYQIVGDLEADIAQGRLSVSSPFARALIGQHAGDTVTVHAPGGDREYEILRVEYR